MADKATGTGAGALGAGPKFVQIMSFFTAMNGGLKFRSNPPIGRIEYNLMSKFCLLLAVEGPMDFAQIGHIDSHLTSHYPSFGSILT